jgi:hypothetical protein
MRNSDVYRSVYGPPPAASPQRARPSKHVSMKNVAERPAAASDPRPAAAGEIR